jgi:hypothetical protein
MPGWAPAGAWGSLPGLAGGLGIAMHAGWRPGSRDARWTEAWGSRCTLDRSLGIAMHASGSLKQGPIKKNIKYIKKKKKVPRLRN